MLSCCGDEAVLADLASPQALLEESEIMLTTGGFYSKASMMFRQFCAAEKEGVASCTTAAACSTFGVSQGGIRASCRGRGPAAEE